MNDEKTNKIMSSEELDDVLPKYEPIKLSGKNLGQNYVSAFNTGMNIYQCVNYLQGNIDWTIKAVNDVVKSWNTEVSESIDQSKAIVRETTTEQFNTEWTNKQPELIEQVNTLTTNQFNEDWGVLENRINTTLENQNTNIENIQNEQNELETNTNNNINAQNTKINSIQTQQTNLANQQINLANEQTTLSNRMDTFTSLSAGSTTGDAELQDIRVGANGVTYNNAGDAVRGQYSQLKEDLINLNEFNYSKFKVEGEYANASNGVISVNEHFTRTNYIKCNEFSVLKIYSSLEVEHNCFYSDIKEFISSFNLKVGWNNIVVPSNAVYVVLSTLNENFDDLKIEYQLLTLIRNVDEKAKTNNDIIRNDAENLKHYKCNFEKTNCIINANNIIGIGVVGSDLLNYARIKSEYVAIADELFPIDNVHYILSVCTNSDNYGKLFIFKIGSTEFKKSEISYLDNDNTGIIDVKYINERTVEISNNIGNAVIDLSKVGNEIGYNLYFPSKLYGGIVSEYTPKFYFIDLTLTDRESNYKNKIWFAIGDSITEQGYYSDMVMVLNNFSLKNYGHSGLSYKELLGVYEEIFSNPNTPNVITLFAGTNDFGHSSSIDDMKSAMSLMIENIYSHYKETNIIIITPLQRNYNGEIETETKGLGPNNLGLYLIDYVKAIKEIAEKYSLPVIDLYSYGGINTLNALDRTTDGLHPNKKYSDRIGYIIGKEIKKYLP